MSDYNICGKCEKPLMYGAIARCNTCGINYHVTCVTDGVCHKCHPKTAFKHSWLFITTVNIILMPVTVFGVSQAVHLWFGLPAIDSLITSVTLTAASNLCVQEVRINKLTTKLKNLESIIQKGTHHDQCNKSK